MTIAAPQREADATTILPPILAAIGAATLAWMTLSSALLACVIGLVVLAGCPPWGLPERRNVAALSALVIAVIIRFAGDSTERLFPSLMLLAVGAAAFLWWRASAAERFPLPEMLVLICVLYGVVGSLLSTSVFVLGASLGPADRERGLYLLVLFAAAVVAGARFSVSPRSTAQQEVTSIRRAAAVAATGLVVSEGISVLDLGLGAVETIPKILLWGGVAALWWRRIELGERSAGRIAMVFVASEFVAGLAEGLLYAGAGSAITVLAVHVYLRRRAPVLVLMLALAGALVLNSAKTTYRQDVGGTANVAEGGAVQAVLGYVSVTRQTLGEDLDIVASDSARRFAYSSDLLGYVGARVPDIYSRADMETYRFALTAVIPRPLLPGKGRADFANDYGHRYGLLNYNDYVTAANIPAPTEAYINAGLGGMIGVGLLLGSGLANLAARLGRSLLHRSVAGGVLAVFATRATESDASVYLPYLLVSPFIVWLVVRLLVSEREHGASVAAR